MEIIRQDIRYALRMFAQKPGFTLVAVIALALGIGANTAIFSVVDAVLLKPLPYSDPQRLVMIWENDTQEGNPRNPVAPANFIDFRDSNNSFEELAYFSTPGGTNLTGGDEPVRVESTGVSVNFFSLLGVAPAMGRGFQPGDGDPEAERAIVISHGLWQRRFGADPDMIGKTVMLEGEKWNVVGIMPASFQFPESVEVWVPFPFSPQQAANRRTHFLSVFGRLKPGAQLEQARSEMASVAGNLAEQYPDTNTGRGATLVTLQDQVVGDVRPALVVLLGAVAFVLLIACANVANLLLTRAAARQKEFALRTALGATRARLVRQLLTESALLAAAGGALGLLFALWGIDLLLAIGLSKIPRLEDAGVNWQVLGFTLALSVATGIIFGLAPALQASRPSLNESLKEAGRGSGGGTARLRGRSLLVISEVALALVLLIGAGLMIKSFARLQQVETGFDPENVLTMQLSLPSLKYREAHQVASFYGQLVERVQALAGVRAAGVVSRLPLAGDRSTISFAVEGRPVETGKLPEAHSRVISPGYFRAMGIALVSGREFSDADRSEAPPAVIINESFARSYWPGEEAVGKRIRFGANPQRPWIAVVGVIKDARHFGLDAEARPEVYTSYLQNSSSRMRLVVRTASDPTSLAGAIRGEVQALDRDLPVAQIRTMDELLAGSISQRSLNMLLLAIFAGVALALAAVGLYAVMSYSVTQRTHEIGIRMALGARATDVLRLVVGDGMRLTLTGVAIGLAASFALTRLMQSLLYSVSATDVATFVSLSLLLTLVAGVASYIPARRATRVDPMVALRHE